MAAKLNITIAPLNYADIDACATISRDSFAIDPHTIVKQLGRDGYDMYGMARRGYLANLERRNMVFVKAVDVDTGAVVGYGGWVFPHVKKELVPWIGPSDEKSKEEVEEQKQTDDKAAHRSEEPKREPDAIDRLHAMEDEDMQYFQHKLIPAGEPCMIVMGLVVAPAHQSRGVGSALLRHGNAIADRLGVPVWVHSSHQAVEAYGKGGFEPVRTLDVDLDEYAPRPPRDDEPVMGDKGSGKWGHYVIQYMKRESRKRPVGEKAVPERGA
ncbi:Acyl-CoA N-acyltransferase [Cordyceps fumosorosea ARSEF 2679]|uniref:Acyl-CoA N-acyltransferase n=1 Tax=Cordyceps fumosorosea (strain ARSEF 2679) TaxID=1081104 RepID=A0A168CAM5_CORFA|nr:Acyl-CoA N-acyltransferase [Cordyceps fumosorosea ARSEF 2679]OAA71157.1 Acyl-CoA N-acyltransferase [Cordyceps fumosorosea ARSEF 2679]